MKTWKQCFLSFYLKRSHYAPNQIRLGGMHYIFFTAIFSCKCLVNKVVQYLSYSGWFCYPGGQYLTIIASASSNESAVRCFVYMYVHVLTYRDLAIHSTGVSRCAAAINCALSSWLAVWPPWSGRCAINIVMYVVEKRSWSCSSYKRRK